MKRIGMSVCVAVSKYGIDKVCEDYLNLCTAEAIPVHELSFSVANQPEGIDIFSVLDNYKNIVEFIREEKPDIVQSVQLNVDVELACRQLHIPHIMNIYQVLPEFFAFEYPDVFPHYHICDSICYADLWHKYLDTESYCVRTIAEGEKKECYIARTEETRFICVGQLCERKNQLEVIKAFGRAVRKGIKGKLQLWGHTDSSYAEKCCQYIVEYGLQDYITVKGFSGNMEEIYLKSDVLICGSTSESYPNVVSEALAHSIIVISTPVAGVPEIIRDKENGYLCSGYRAEEIEEGIITLYDDVKTGRINMILENANRTYEDFHSVAAVTQALTDTYMDILSKYSKQNTCNYGIENLKSEFHGVIQCFEKKQTEFENRDFIEKNLWKIFCVVKKLRANSSVWQQHNCYIWGTGKYGRMYKKLLEIFIPDLEIAGFIDSYKTGMCMNYDIFSPDEVLQGNRSIIFVGVLNKEKIMQKMSDYDYRYNIDYFTFEKLPW